MKWWNHPKWTSSLLAATCSLALLVGAPAYGQDAVEEEDPRVGLYSSETGDNRFVLDRTNDFARLKFAEKNEIVHLEIVPGPRGDTFFKDGCGNTVLRLTPFGGATLYNVDTQEGEAFGRAETAEPLRITRLTSQEVEAKAKVGLAAFDEDYGYSIVFEADYYAGASQGVGAATLLDAIDNTLVALRRISQDEVGREAITESVGQISFHAGSSKSIALEEQHLVVRYLWGGNVEGRPSSAEIVCYLENNL